MEATAERRIFDEVLEKLRVLGNDLKAALYFGGLRVDCFNRMKEIASQLNKIDVTDFIGSWLKMPSNREILEVYVDEVLQTYCYHKEVEKANFKPEQIGEDYVQLADTYDRWRNTIILKLERCLPEGAAMMYDYKKYVMFPESKGGLTKKRKGGYKEISFSDSLLVDDKDGLLNLLHKFIGGRKGKFVAKVIKVCCDKGLMDKPTYTQVKNEFGDIGDKSAYNYSYDEKNPIVEALKKYL